MVAYDLNTGSVYRIESCGGLALAEDGRVDHRKTDAGRKLRVTTGVIPVEPLREAAWAIFSAPHVQDDIVHETGFGRSPPPNMIIGREASQTSSGLGMNFTSSSAHTTLDWQWTDGVDAVPPTGQLSWPTDLDDPAGDHAVRLLRIAEEAMVSGCAKARLPRYLADGLELDGVSGLDADTASLKGASEALRDAMTDVASQGRCLHTKGVAR